MYVVVSSKDDVKRGAYVTVISYDLHDLTYLAFAHHRAVLDALTALDQDKQQGYTRIDRATPLVER